MKYTFITIFFLSSVVYLSGYIVRAQEIKIDDVIETPLSLTDQKILYLANDKVKDLVASSSLPVIEAIKLDKQSSDTKAITDRLDRIIDLLIDLKRK